MATSFICTACGTQFPPTGRPPPCCPICQDERQFVPASGQNWTSLEQLARGHKALLKEEHGLLGIGCAPDFAIGQRALLLPTPAGNILWDCIAFLDSTLVTVIRALGGLAGIAISHPHYYTTMLEWSRAFGGVPIHLHAADREWVMRPGPEIAFWEGETKPIAPGVTLIRLGGHFAGGTVLHAAEAADGRGALLSGDILQVVPDRRHVGLMRSYPNLIPLGEAAVRRMGETIETWDFDAVYGAFWGRVIPQGGKQAVAESVGRHIAHLHRDWP
ncbi:MAG TPA: MBL fold metallo-hydrolase [Roseomonas sp.]|nr:MBL fold metallo-hydrolase [Roseomonas sp.]